MKRALVKGLGLGVVGRMPGGPRLYRRLTRDWMGTQAAHVDKLQRVWPGYAQVWESLCGLELEGLDIWVHEGGWTPFPFFANYFLSGKPGAVTNSEGHILDKYVARAVNGVLSASWSPGLGTEARRCKLEALRWETATEAIAQLGGRAVRCERGAKVALESESVDLCHSGGVLEHYSPDQLASYLRECHRILRPGGIASHILDCRDHLHHADPSLPFLAHLAWPVWAYKIGFGHELGYHNRLLPTQTARMCEEAGFEVIALKRMILPERRYVDEDEALEGQPGISRRMLHRQFRGMREEDLRTAAAHYLLRKLRRQQPPTSRNRSTLSTSSARSP